MPALLLLLVPALLLSRRARRFLGGHPMDGQYRTNATFSRAPTKALHPTADRSRWHWRPGWHRTAARLGGLTLAVSLTYGLLEARTTVLVALGLIVAALLGIAGWYTARGVRSWLRACTWDRNRPWRSIGNALTLPVRHHLYYRRPARAVLATPAILGGPPAWLRVPIDRSRAAIGLTAEQRGDPARHQVALATLATVLALEAPETSTRLHGRRPQLALTPGLPPPSAPSWDDLAPAIAAQPRKTLTFGPGKGGKLIQASYGDSPHLAIPGGSGGGKSNLIAVLVLQELIRGTLVFILDPKGDSHLWAVGLPNVIYCTKPESIQAALEWLGAERVRRGDTSFWSAVQNSGIDRAKRGVRIVAILEEMNIGMPGLKAHWAAVRDRKRDPKESPAIGGMREGACAGRSQDMHFWFAAQMFNVESTGVRDPTIRSQAGIKAMLRWDQRGWDMAVGKEVPMPPPVKIPGRSQIVTADGPRECQTPYLHLDDKDHPEVHETAVRWARELAVSGAKAAIPSGPAGVPRKLWPSCVLGQTDSDTGPGQDSNVLGQTSPEVAAITLSAAVQEGLFPSLDAAQKAIQRRELAPAGKDGKAHTFRRGELVAAASRVNGRKPKEDQ